jgi:hypothetical protein
LREAAEKLLKSPLGYGAGKRAMFKNKIFEEIIREMYLVLPLLEEKDLDPKLWEPYQDWREKIRKMPITFNIEKGESEELKHFKEEMVTAIRKRRKELEVENTQQRKNDSKEKKEQADF